MFSHSIQFVETFL